MQSLRRSLLLGILLPVGAFIAVDTVLLYRNALTAVNVAYDRTLLASAKSIGEQLTLVNQNNQLSILANVQYSALEAFQTDVLSRFTYRVSDGQGHTIDGDSDLPEWTGTLPNQGPYAALVDFYDDQFRGDPVRVAVLLQPVASTSGSRMATIQVAETMELRERLAQNILKETLLRQAALAAFIALITVAVVQWATRPVRSLRQQILKRPIGDLSPLPTANMPKELVPLLTATNDTMTRLNGLLSNQKRFVRDTAHQLRTPLAVLKTQVQSALRGDVEPMAGLAEMNQTVNRASNLANQMLALAKVTQLQQQGPHAPRDWAPLLKEVVVDLSPLISEKNLIFELVDEPCMVWAHEWMLKELARNLLHNAIKHSPDQGRLCVSLTRTDKLIELKITDQGPGLSDYVRERLFQPFSPGNPNQGSGLGLSICHEIVQSLKGHIQFTNEGQESIYPSATGPAGTTVPGTNGHRSGLTCQVRLPLKAAV